MQEKFIEWWEEYKTLYPPKGNASFYYSDNKEYAQEGFNAGWEEARLTYSVCPMCEYSLRNCECTRK